MTPEKLRELSAAIDEAVQARDQAIGEAAREGMRQTQIVEATGLVRERVRLIERAQGVPRRK